MAPSPWSDLIDVDTLYSLHADAIQRFGGSSSRGDERPCLEGSLGAAWNAQLYAAADSDGATPWLCFAGCLLYYLTKNHCFVDGNKRVAWLAMVEVLYRRGLTIDATDDEAEQLCVSIIQNEMGSAILVSSWLAERLKSSLS